MIKASYDLQPPAGTPLRADVAAQVALSLPGCQGAMRAGLAKALAVAAVREAHEEAGLFCGSVVQSGACDSIFFFGDIAYFSSRRTAAAGGSGQPGVSGSHADTGIGADPLCSAYLRVRR